MNEGKINYEFIDWNKLQNLVKILAKKVKESGYKPDVILGISKGGWVVSRLLCDYIDCKDIIGFDLKQNEKISLDLIDENLLEKNILLVDDVMDESSLKSITSMIPSEKSRIRILSLFYTKGSLRPDYYIREVFNTIVFPWNLESIKKRKSLRANFKAILA